MFGTTFLKGTGLTAGDYLGACADVCIGSFSCLNHHVSA